MFKMGGPVKGSWMVLESLTWTRLFCRRSCSRFRCWIGALASRLPAFLRPAGAATRTVQLGPPTAGTGTRIQTVV